MYPEIISPCGNYLCKPEFKPSEQTRSMVLVLSYSHRLTFPFEYAIRSFRKANPDIKEVLLFLAETGTMKDKLFSELAGMLVSVVSCTQVGPTPLLGPKSCVYYAARFLAANAYFWMDLDIIHVTKYGDLSFARIMLARSPLEVYYTPEKVSSNEGNLFYHCFRKGGIYNGAVEDISTYRLSALDDVFDTFRRLPNTGVMVAGYQAATMLHAALVDIVTEVPGIRLWMCQKKEAFTAHREQAVFSMALNLSGVRCFLYGDLLNYQTLTRPVMEDLPENAGNIALHFNGYHSPDSPSRKSFNNLLANSREFRQACGMQEIVISEPIVTDIEGHKIDVPTLDGPLNL